YGSLRMPNELLRNRLLAALPLSEFALLAPHLHEISCPLGMILHEPGGQVDRVYFPLGGVISLVVVMRNGSAVEAAMAGREGVIGALAAGRQTAFSRAVVQTPGNCAAIWAPEFVQVCRNSEHLRNLVISYKEFLLAQIQQTAACNALHSMK